MPTISTLAELIGLIVSSFNAVEFGPLHYRYLEWDKVQALKNSGGDFDKSLCLSNEALAEILWWTNNVSTEIRRIDHINCNLSLTTDTSKEGWGAVFDTLPHSGVKQATGGRWVHHEKHSHINVLELKASFFGLKSFASDLTNVHIKVSMDNTTAIAYVNHMGGSHSIECNEVAMFIWAFCRQRDIWLTAVHLPGHLNVLADQKSRIFDDKTEWHFNPSVFRKIVLKFVTPEIDLFASRLNYQLKPYVAWMPDPEAQYIDAFTRDWSSFILYAFPPFCTLTRVLKKIEYDGATGIVIVPNWPTQVWFPLLRRLLLAEPMELGWQDNLPDLPFRQGVHPLGRKVKLMACHLCGKH